MKSMPATIETNEIEELAQQAAEFLRAGKLIGVPTETVYGIAASMKQPRALDALRSALHIQSNPAWVIHVAAIEGPAEFIRHIPVLARRLMRGLWPGPVAIELPLESSDLERLRERLGRTVADEALTDGFLTFRCSEPAITRRIVDIAGGPVTIAGTAGNDLIATAEDLPAALGNQLAMTVRGPAPRYKVPSTLVRVRGHYLDVRREGAVAERVIRRLEDQVIVFVCTGNTCRSPMAAGLAAKILAEKLHIPAEELPRQHLVVRSAGVHAAGGMPAAADAVRVMRDMGVDIQKHRSAPLTDELLRRADMIYTMTQDHRDEIISRYPSLSQKTVTLDPDGDIDDPVGKGEQIYRRTAQRLETLIRNRLAELEL
jgi:protein-tyrosine phosphatase